MSNENQPGSEDHTWTMHMEMLMKRKRGLEANEVVREAISEWYRENGLPEPDWRMKKPRFDKDGNIIRPE